MDADLYLTVRNLDAHVQRLTQAVEDLRDEFRTADDRAAINGRALTLSLLFAAAKVTNAPIVMKDLEQDADRIEHAAVT